jgi:hypothetical protein
MKKVNSVKEDNMQQLYSKYKEKIKSHAGLGAIRYLFNRM